MSYIYNIKYLNKIKMKIKQNLVIFLTLLLLSFVSFSTQKLTEEALLMKNYLMSKARTTSQNIKSASQIRLNFKTNLIVVRDINKPRDAIVKNYKAHAILEPTTLTISTIGAKKGKVKKFFWTE